MASGSGRGGGGGSGKGGSTAARARYKQGSGSGLDSAIKEGSKQGISDALGRMKAGEGVTISSRDNLSGKTTQTTYTKDSARSWTRESNGKRTKISAKQAASSIFYSGSARVVGHSKRG